jgi:putative phosphoesterase
MRGLKKHFEVINLFSSEQNIKIGLVSDTHIPRDAKQIPPQVKEVFAGVGLILHGGDIYTLEVLDELESIAPVLAAEGNGDIWLPRDPRIKESHVLDIQGLRVGLTHSLEYPEPFWRSLESAMNSEFGGRVDVLIFGGSHKALIETFKGVLLVNPGSPTLPLGLPQLGTVGILEINRGKIEAQIIQLR